MKRFKLFTGAAALLAMGAFSSCSSDEPLKPGNDIAEVDETRYITVALSAPASLSRAFEDGTKHESEVKRLDFIFYDRAGNPTGKTQSFIGADLTGPADAPNFAEGPFESGNVTRIWTAVVPVELTQGENLPSQVICLVNAKAAALTNLKNLTLEGAGSLIEQTRDYIVQDDAFLMTNSTYYGTSELTGQTNARICATPINKSQLYPTKEEAKAAITQDAVTTAAMVNIYVERLAAKVGLTMASTAPKAYTLNDGDTGTGEVSLTFVPEYWFVNAVAKTTYITKRYGVPAGDGTTAISMDPGYDAINTNFTTYGNAKMNEGKWNSAINHRSYWAMSPSYAANNFPKVSDQVYDVEPKTDNKKDYQQSYYSYNDVKGMTLTQNDATVAIKGDVAAGAVKYNNGFSITEVGEHTDGFIYTKETTTAISQIRNLEGNPAATVASAVIVGHYHVGTTAPEGEYPTFWIDRSTNTFYGAEANAIKTLMERNGFIYTDAAGTELLTTGLVLKHPDAATREQLPNPYVPGRLVTLQIPAVPDAGADTQYYYYDGKAYVQVTNATTLAAANAQLAQGLGYLDMFNHGRAFFNMPIRHLGWDEAYLVDKAYQWEKMAVGALGVVRNHVYKITVNTIEGLGTGLRSDDQPIVPPVETLNQYVAMRLNILSWNVANDWTVDL